MPEPALTIRCFIYSTFVWFFVLHVSLLVNCQILNPPYFNLAEGRNITATATCGEGVPEPELYCKLVGAYWLDKPDNLPVNLIQGQACDFCDPSDPNLAHSAEYAIDGTERWWQSPPLSRGTKYNEVNLTIDLGQEFNVAYVFIKMANSPRPGIWALERSRDYGKTYAPWQFFADTEGDCINYFGHASLNRIIDVDSVICETKFSKVVPLEGGEIVVSLLNDRPGADNFSTSATLQEWTTATNIRLRLLRPKTTLGHLLSVARQDPTVTRRYFYSIKDINIGGRCVCNGHASQCDQIQQTDPYKLLCRCQHNTCGAQCEQCCPGYRQHKWRRATIENPNVCEKCNCHDHSNDCIYDEDVEKKRLSLDIHDNYRGGGVCINCQHNTEGINCNKCKPGFYRPRNRPLDSPDVCVPCQCDLHFSTGNCTEATGQCECKKNFLPPNCNECNFGYFGYPHCIECHCFPNGTWGNVCQTDTGTCPCRTGYSGQFCKQCSEGFYGFPNCQQCDCESRYSENQFCDIETGQCNCEKGYFGRRCDQCAVGYWNYPECEKCFCSLVGTNEEICNNLTSKCYCREGYDGERCDRCQDGYFGYPNCTKCMCDEVGSLKQGCDDYGRCSCKHNFGGSKCADCSPGYYKPKQCVPCSCTVPGSNGLTCDINGRCVCHDKFEGDKCDKCKEGYYNYPRCEECNCNPAGLIAQFGGCDKVELGKLCECKERVTGRICNQCKDLYWNLNINNHLGCEECMCDRNGTIGSLGVCDGISGQCTCKSKVTGRRCDYCKDDTYSIGGENLFGCLDCNCDFGGSIHAACDKTSGQCYCKPRIKGRRCTEPIDVNYFPTLYQYQYEVEDWRNPTGSPARFGYDENIFPNYSWRGYATFTDLQRGVITNITIQKPSFYRPIFRYVNLNKDPIIGTLTFTPIESIGEVQQSSMITFEPVKDPKLLLAVGKPGLPVVPFVLNPGQWEVSLKVDKNDLFLDYMVLMPQAYYEPTLFQDKVTATCRLEDNKLCRDYSYPQFPEQSGSVRGNAAFVVDGDQREKIRVFEDENVFKTLKVEGTPAWIHENQSDFVVDMSINTPGQYVLVIVYHNPKDADSETGQKFLQKLKIETTAMKNGNHLGTIVLSSCPYSFLCRQLVTTDEGEIAVVEPKDNYVQLNFALDKPVPSKLGLAIDSIVAIPLEQWSLDYVIPSFICVKKAGNCIDSSFAFVPEATKVEVEKENAEKITKNYPFEVDNVNDVNLPKLILLDGQNSADVRGSVGKSGSYNIIVHYYQPNSPSFNLEVIIQDGQFYNGIVPIKHCPNRNGCRAVVKQRDENTTLFQIGENFMLTLKQPDNKNIWLDYILVVPADHFEPEILNLKEYDKINDFLAQCAQNTFYINPDEASEFCRSSIFSLTVDYNGGALACQCSIDGSSEYKCNPFGGQCKCKENVIGRTCSRCKTGYFGFPRCKQCNCPSTAVCHPVTGECICPRGVTGERCDRCLPLTFGFDPIIGCEDCNCEPHGVQNRDLQCNVDTGQCNCKTNVVGRSCNKCRPGFWAHPTCELCRCDIRGTTADICDQTTSRCFCKENVYGEYCEQCKPDAYFLEESNPLGCTKCFCFGTTDRCTSSYLKVIQTQSMESDWRVVRLQFTEKSMQENPDDRIKIKYGGGKIQIDLFEEEPERSDSKTQTNNVIYFAVPKEYLGNKITSYGGLLKYSIQNIQSGSDPTGHVAADLVLKGGSNLTIIHEHIEQPTKEEKFEFTTRLNEREFRHLNGFEVSREQLMMILVKLEAIYIRGTYFEPISTIYLENVLMDSAIEGRRLADAPRAFAVEQCSCPNNYKGTSCEECASGSYRAKTGPHLGFCFPCQCNGHSNECDPVTGVCFNCKHNTEGEHCERCVAGYHGNATMGTPYDCLICACPLPIATNNFATSCEVSSSGLDVKCQCKPGYVGDRCEKCGAAHFGRPDVSGQTCQWCNCSGNIDITMPGSCDATSGECIMCLNNTYGRSCEVCKPGYFGDAIAKKDCKECSCDSCGTERCDHFTGVCNCKSNIVGQNCNQCALDHWDFKSCRGCRSCNCGIASDGSSCDDETGQCKCRPGATGRTCDTCEAGFWKYTKFGCTSCKCIEKFSYGAVCDQQTGRCQCLPGVEGDKCDRCPWRYVFIPKTGCRECGLCMHMLLDDTDNLSVMIDPLKNEIKDTTTSVFMYQRINHFNKTFLAYNERVEKVKEKPKFVDLGPVSKDTQKLNEDVIILQNKEENSLKEASKIMFDATSIKEDVEVMDGLIRQKIFESSLVVEEIKQLEEGFQMSHLMTLNLIDRKINEGQWILDELKNRHFDEGRNKSETEVDESNNLLDKIVQFKSPAVQNQDAINITSYNLTKTTKLFSEMMNLSQDALKMIVKTEELNKLSLNRQLNKNIEQIEMQFKDTNSSLEGTKRFLDDSKKALTSSESQMADISILSGKMTNKKPQLQNKITELVALNKESRPLVDKAEIHKNDLRRLSLELDMIFLNTRNRAEDPVKAANVYNLIVESLQNATKSSEEAIEKISNIDAITSIVEQVKNFKNKIIEDNLQAKESEKTIKTALEKTFHSAKENVNKIDKQTSVGETNLGVIKQELGKFLQTGTVSNLGKHASEISASAKETSNKSSTEINNLAKRIEEMQTKAEALPKDGNAATKQGINYINRISSKLEEFDAKRDDIKKKHEELKGMRGEMTKAIADLRRKIDLIRSKANRIKVGVDFYSNTTLQLRNPEGFASKSATNTKFSLFFKTKEPNGLIAYIGNPILIPGKQKRSDSEDEVKMLTSMSRKVILKDYFALEIIEGRMHLHVDLGAGSNTISNNQVVNDGEWHQAIVERVGKIISLTIRTQSGVDSISEGIVQGPTSVFNLDQQLSCIFIGGIPDNVKVQEEVFNKRFSGTMEEVTLGEVPLGLWNFHGKDNLFGAKERDSLVDLVPPDVFKFDGHGYLILDRQRLQFVNDTFVQLKFRTFSKEGLLFLIGNPIERNFLALEVRDGRVHFKYDLGSATHVLSSDQTYNDGKWHNIEANRIQKESVLYIDGSLVAQGDAIGMSTQLSTTDEIYIGGFPKEHSYYAVTNKDFEGCIKSVQISSEVQNLNKNKEAFRAVPGCPATGSRIAVFSNDSLGYININTVIDMSSPVPVALTFKTQNPNGLLFYLASDDHSTYLTAYIENGELVFRAYPGGAVKTTHEIVYNDNQWHYIIANLTHKRMKLDVDDINSFTIETTEEADVNSGSAKQVYFGGVPSSVSSVASAFTETKIPKSFVGCLGDATINDKIQNFAESQDRPNASLTTCPLSDDLLSESEDKLTTEIIIATTKPDIMLKPDEELSTAHPSPVGQCKLSPVPRKDYEVTERNGLRFGNKQFSRHEFVIKTQVGNDLQDESGFEIEFKTTQDEGVIFYVASQNNIDFVSLYMFDGKVYYGWNCGSGKALLMSSSAYNDGKWHKATFSRKGQNGILRIDEGKEEIFGSSNGSANSLNVRSPIFIGGLNELLTKHARDNFKGSDKPGSISHVTNSFPGCLRELYVHGRKYEFSVESTGYDVQPCSESVEEGSFFHSDGGYIKLLDEFRVGNKFELEMEIKPRIPSGVLLAVFGKPDFLLLQLHDGKLTFSVDNGYGPINATYDPPSKYYFCDGLWHDIKAIKVNNVVTLKIDDIGMEPSIGIGGVSSTDTKDPLYIGGLPPDLMTLKGIGDHFVGCLRINAMNKKRQSFNQARIFGHVTLNSCSTL